LSSSVKTNGKQQQQQQQSQVTKKLLLDPQNNAVTTAITTTPTQPNTPRTMTPPSSLPLDEPKRFSKSICSWSKQLMKLVFGSGLGPIILLDIAIYCYCRLLYCKLGDAAVSIAIKGNILQ
jgi:hypothetical protein